MFKIWTSLPNRIWFTGHWVGTIRIWFRKKRKKIFYACVPLMSINNSTCLDLPKLRRMAQCIQFKKNNHLRCQILEWQPKSSLYGSLGLSADWNRRWGGGGWRWGECARVKLVPLCSIPLYTYKALTTHGVLWSEYAQMYKKAAKYDKRSL
jgi:hypothetical protein